MTLDNLESRMDSLRANLEARDALPKDIDEAIQMYRELIVKLHIDDQRMVRLCQVLTDHGLVTFGGCEGHGAYLPRIFFHQPADHGKLIDLTHTLDDLSRTTNFNWGVRVVGNWNAGVTLYYSLEPFHERGPIDPKEDYEKLLEDMDLIAMFMLYDSA